MSLNFTLFGGSRFNFHVYFEREKFHFVFCWCGHHYYLERSSSELFLVCFVWCAVSDIFPLVSASLAKVLFIIRSSLAMRSSPIVFYCPNWYYKNFVFFHGSFPLLSYLLTFELEQLFINLKWSKFLVQ